MAWTSSADHEGTFALAGGAARSKTRRSWRQPELATAFSQGPLALATTAHLCSLAVIAPFASENPVVAVPVLIGLSISYLTLSRAKHGQASAAPAATADDATEAAIGEPEPPYGDLARMCCVPAAVKAGNTELQTAAPAAHRIEGTEVSAELRADLMARVSHELRTPLNAVMGFSDLMGNQLFGPLGHPRYEEYVGHIRESSEKLLKSAEDTLAMTSLMAKSPSRSDREAICLGSLFNEAKSSIAREAGKRGLSCRSEIDMEIEVMANRRALRQALINVMSEAIVQAEEGSAITIAASSDAQRVSFIVTVDRIAQRSQEEHRSLPLCLARTLLELDGCRMSEGSVTSAPWSVSVWLDSASQRDFFAQRLAS